MYELSLFSGAGGGLLGTKLLGWTAVGYVEYDDYCQRVIAARINDGHLDQAPIFGDIRTFISDGYADSYTGLVDVVTAGFPCQPFSVAGQRKGDDDSRNMWPQTLDIIRRVRPRLAYLENVPGLLAHEYARRIYGDLAESGYDAEWRILSAAECGAPHKRDRWWCLAYTTGPEVWRRPEEDGARKPNTAIGSGNSHSDASNAISDGIRNEPESERRGSGKAQLKHNGSAGIVADTSRIQQGREEQRTERQRARQSSQHASNADSAGCSEQRRGKSVQAEQSAVKRTGWWEFEPDVGRVANGVANRVDRLKSLGNGQVSAVVRTAYELLQVDRDA